MKKKRILLTAAAAAVLSAGALTVAAAYDSATDPLVTYSFLRDVFKKEIIAEIDTRFEELKNDYQPSSDKTSDNSNDFFPGKTDFSQALQNYEVIELTSGDALYAAGVCEIILRAGKANCIAPDANQGIADVTDSTEILNGVSLTKNHYCLIPRGDGRGVYAASESVFIMVRGDYTIVEN